MKLEQPAVIEIFYEDSKERPVRFDGVLDLTEGVDGSLKIVYEDQIIRVRPSYRYYILHVNGEDDGESEPSRPW